MQKSLGMIEFKSIARGLEAADAMIKAANVTVLAARTVCPGKFIILVSGSVQDVTTSVVQGAADAESLVLDKFIIPSIHQAVLEAFEGKINKERKEAVGIMEFHRAAAGIRALDFALKFANVSLLKLNIGFGINGKSYFMITGSVSDVEEAVREAEAKSDLKKIMYKAVIPNPSDELIESFV